MTGCGWFVILSETKDLVVAGMKRGFINSFLDPAIKSQDDSPEHSLTLFEI